jgi:hypothetical protein
MRIAQSLLAAGGNMLKCFPTSRLRSRAASIDGIIRCGSHKRVTDCLLRGKSGSAIPAARQSQLSTAIRTLGAALDCRIPNAESAQGNRRALGCVASNMIKRFLCPRGLTIRAAAQRN